MNTEALIKLKGNVRKILRRVSKPVNYLLLFIFVISVCFLGIRFYMQKMGIPKKGDIHRAVEKNEEGRVFVWLILRPELCRQRNGSMAMPLHTAARFNRRNCAVWLIFWGASPDASDRLGRKPLHIASYYGHSSMVKLLIRKGANVNSKDFAGRTPLNIAVLWHRTETADILRQYGAQDP